MRALWLALAALAVSCSGSQARPSGPPPEYEKPVVTAWDAGPPPPDEFSEAERGGEPVTDTEEQTSGDAGNDALPPVH